MQLAPGQLTLPAYKEGEWNDQSIYINGVRLAGIMGSKCGVKTEKKHLLAEGDSPFWIQSGNREPTGTLKILKSTFDALTAAAIAAGGRDVTDIEFDIVNTYRAQGLRPLVRVTQTGVQISSFEYGWDQGATEMVIELPYLYLDWTFTIG